MLYKKKYAGMEPCSLPHLCASPHKLIRPSPSASLSLLSLSLLFLFLFSIFSLSLALSLSLLLFLSPSVFVWVWIGGARGEEEERRHRQEEGKEVSITTEHERDLAENGRESTPHSTSTRKKQNDDSPIARLLQ